MFNSNKYIATYISLNVLSTENIVFGKNVQLGSLPLTQAGLETKSQKSVVLLINWNNLFARIYISLAWNGTKPFILIIPLGVI